MRMLQYQVALGLIILACGIVTAGLLAGETPRGRVVGSLRAAESGNKLGHIRVALVSAGNVHEEIPGRTDRQGRFTFSHVPVGRYTLTASTRAHEQPTQPIEVHEGRTTSADFELQPSQPFLRLFQGQRVFTTHEKATMRCHGFALADTLTVSLLRLDPRVAVRHWSGFLPDALTLHGQQLDAADLSTVPELTPVRTFSQNISARRDIEGVFTQQIALGNLAPGMYLLAVETLGKRALGVLTVTDLGIIVKATPDAVLVYAVGLESNVPVPGAAIEAQRDGKTVAGGTTNADGLLTLALPKNPGENELTVVGHAGASVAVASVYTSWHEQNGARRVYTYTDRPVYRPGQQVYFKSLVRDLRDDSYQVPANLGAQVRVTDPRDNLIYSGTQATGTYGSLAGAFSLSSAALPGTYAMTVSLDGAPYETTFDVAEYRKPEYEVTVQTARPRYTRREPITATISAQYYYGAPVPNAKVNYTVMRSPYWVCDECAAWDEDLFAPSEAGGMDMGGEFVRDGEGTTDNNGKLTITLPSSLAHPQKQAEEDETQDWRYEITANVTDLSQRAVTGTGATLVTQGEFRLTATPESWMARPGQPAVFDLRAVDYDGKPVSGARGTAQFARTDWQNGRQTLTEPMSAAWQADAAGHASVTFTPKRDGDYRLDCATRDARGNTITANAYLWVMSGDTGDFNYPYQDIDVHADKKSYREGDVAEIVVNTRYAPATALLTVEGAKVLESRLVKLTARTTVLKVPIRPAYMPAVHVACCFLHGKKFFSGEALCNVSRERKALDVQIVPNQQKYQPGDKATYQIKTLTTDHKPAQAEVSLGVVDEAVYAIEPDNTPNIISYFYPKRAMEVNTAFSFPDIYLSGDDKAGSTIRTRRFFPDTALWRPTIVTDKQGLATLSFTLPDSLTTWRATARAATLDTRVGQATAKVIVQKPFLVRLEAPRFFTQGDQVTLSAVAQNLTTGPLTATLGLGGTGLDFSRVQTRQVSLAAGQTGRAEWTVTAPNIGAADVRVWGKAGTLDDAMALKLPVRPRGRAQQTARAGLVDAAAAQRFEVRQDCLPGTQHLTVRLTPSLAGAMLSSLDYLAEYPYGCVEQTMSAFLPDIVIMQMLKDFKLNNPALQKRLPDMVNVGFLKLYALQHNDQGWGWWTYDKSDPWMTTYVVYGLLRAKEAGFPVNPKVLEEGINLLKAAAPPPATGYVRQPDGTLLPVVSPQAARRARGEADILWSGHADPNVRIFAAYVLALAGAREDAQAMVDEYTGPQHATDRAKLNDWGRAVLARADAQLGRLDDGRAVWNEEWPRFTGHHLDTSGVWHWWMETDVAAALLAAGTQLFPQDPRLPELVRWLLAQRQDNHWDSTRDTAAILDALSRYLRVTRELQPDMQATVTVNGHVVADRHFTAADVFQPEITLPLGAATLGNAVVNVQISKTGAGRLYYTATLDQTLSSGLYAPVYGDGLAIERRYRKVSPHAGGTEIDTGAPGQTAFNSGDAIEVQLTIRAQRHLEYLMVQDPLPAGCEARDRGAVDEEEWSNWWAEQIVRDQSVSFAVRDLDPGVRRITYYIYAGIPGVYTALPPRIFDMYHPDISGSGPAATVTIKE